MDHVVLQARKELFVMNSKVSDWPHEGRLYADVPVAWHVRERQEPPVPYEQAIEGYEPGVNGTPAESYIDGLFTAEEAALVCKYLQEHYTQTTELWTVHLPVSSNSAGAWCLPPAKGRDVYRLDEEHGCDLPFRVGGWYDIATPEERSGSSSDERNEEIVAMERRVQNTNVARLFGVGQALLADECLVRDVMSDPSKRDQVGKYMAVGSSGGELDFPYDIRSVGDHHRGLALMMRSRLLEMENTWMAGDRELGNCQPSPSTQEKRSRAARECLSRGMGTIYKDL